MSFTDAFTVSAPVTAPLFGEQQAYLGLPVIALAFDSRVTVQADSHESNTIILRRPAAPEECVSLGAARPPTSEGLLARAADAIRGLGIELTSGYSLKLTSDLPLRAGLGQDAATAVALTLALLRCTNQLQSFTGIAIADVAHAILGDKSPRALYDALVSSLGGKQHLAGSQATSLAGADLRELVIGFSDAPSPSGRSLLKDQAKGAVDALAARCPSFDLGATPFDAAMPMLRELPDEAASALYALLRGRELCAAATILLESESFEKDRLGEMLDEDHSLLRDYLGVSNDSAEAVVAAAKEAGALGAKVNTAGSSVLAYAPGDEAAVAKAIESQGWTALTVSVADGARLDAGTLVPPWA